MNIITLNTWGGRAGKDQLLEFFEKYKDQTDIFCLQEIWSAPYEHLQGHNAGGLGIDHTNIMVYGLQEISALLTDFVPYFRPHHLDNYGLLMMVRRDLKIKEEGEIFVYKDRYHVPIGDVGFHARNVQYVTIETATGSLTVMNFHGLWNGQGKTDSEDRLDQSRKIIKFTKQFSNNIVLCGDFNLLPETQSVLMLEGSGLRNLIKEYGIFSTRTSFYNKPEKYADYVFVSSGVGVKNFAVLPDEVSDHAALKLKVD